ncbi:unnamed protein product [Cunninghamella blakesleeana]
MTGENTTESTEPTARPTVLEENTSNNNDNTATVTELTEVKEASTIEDNNNNSTEPKEQGNSTSTIVENEPSSSVSNDNTEAQNITLGENINTIATSIDNKPELLLTENENKAETISKEESTNKSSNEINPSYDYTANNNNNSTINTNKNINNDNNSNNVDNDDIREKDDNYIPSEDSTNVKDNTINNESIDNNNNNNSSGSNHDTNVETANLQLNMETQKKEKSTLSIQEIQQQKQEENSTGSSNQLPLSPTIKKENEPTYNTEAQPTQDIPPSPVKIKNDHPTSLSNHSLPPPSSSSSHAPLISNNSNNSNNNNNSNKNDNITEPSIKTETDTTMKPSTNTNTSSSNPPNNNNPSSAQNGFRPLNVKDALTYLDQVKVQFSDHPEVYNKFLDIMKDFKSQAIDTPGVIERVSTLFRGHPLLISGFNTFLPPGYCIECITDELQRDIIRVTTPNGTTTTNAGEPLRLGSDSTGVPTHEQLYYGSSNVNNTNTSYPGYGTTGTGVRPSTSIYGNGHSTTTTTANTGSMHHLQHNSHHPTSNSASLSHPQTHHPHSHLPAQQLHHPTDDNIGNRRTPVEFNHAINYVNKIKNRFSSDPDIYKQFLEILQTYQKEQRPIQEVYSQVQVLFNGDGELLAEFKQFLPDTTGIGSSSVYTSTPNGRKNLMMVPGLSNVTTGRKKRGSSMITSGMSKRTKLQSKMDSQTSEVRSAISLNEDEVVRPFVSGEEVEFFERVKKYIGSKATYNAFLKVLNLFSQQIVDQNVLVNRVEGFIGGNKELFDMFKTLVGYDGKDELIENEPVDDSIKPDLSQSETYGPSYRVIPKAWRESQVCSGKDELCLEVLNDTYMSHPTWASEDSGYVASKKNQYEEALHRVEEERYDYDLNIEANLNTIALLEPIMKKISTMTPEEKLEYTLPIGLGGPSKTIYQRIIKKIYGNEKGIEVINLLHASPAQSVPIVLKRLKQKDDEWKRAQREWNKIWREVEAKNYFKALDYQGITFKAKDKRRITTKNLILEIEDLFLKQQEEYQQKHQDYNISSTSVGATSNLLVPARKPAQFTFYFKDEALFKDITKLIYFAFEHTEIYNNPDIREKIKEFMESLLPLMFNISTIIPNDNNSDMNGVSTPIGEDGGDENATGDDEDGNNDDTADDEAADEADDEEDEESRSVQSYDSDGDAIMNGPSSDASSPNGGKNNGSGRRSGSRNSGRRKTMRPRRSRYQGNNDDGLLKEILTRNMPLNTAAAAAATESSPSISTATTPNNNNNDEEDDIANNGNQGDAETPIQSDADNYSITKPNDSDVDVPDATADDDNDHDSSQQNTPTNNEVNNTMNDDAVTPSLPEPTLSTPIEQIKNNKRQIYNLFANSEYYCFFRLYQMIYERLYQMKQLDEGYKKNPTKTKEETKAVLNLSAKSRRVSGYYLDLSRGYYNALIKLIDKFFEGQVDQQTFEEVSRYIFGRKAYSLFTIDKVVMALLRHANLIVADGKSSLLLDLFKQDYELENVDAQILGEYRLRVEEIVGKEEVLFNLSYDTNRQALSIQILGNNDDYDRNKQDGYDEYVSNYIDWANATTGVNSSNLTSRFLKRNMKKCTDEEARSNIIVRSGMQYKICRDTYHMFYIIGTEDVYMRLPSSTSLQPSHSSSSKWKTWLESDKGWSKGLTDKDQAESNARKLLFPDE